nr:universal stress protein [Nocardioides sp. MAH-18]
MGDLRLLARAGAGVLHAVGTPARRAREGGRPVTILVGHPPRPHDRSAISYAAMLARTRGMGLHVVSVLPAPWPAVPGRASTAAQEAHRERALGYATTVLAEVAPDLPATVEVVPGRSVAGTLLARAREVDASLVVIGSVDEGPWDRVAIGSTGDRLLHAADRAVAVATRGFSTHAVPRFTRATCAFRADRASVEVLRRIGQICADSGAALRVATFGVEGRTMYPPEVAGEEEVVAAFVDQARAAQAAALAQVAAPEGVECTVAVGPDWATAIGRLAWRHDDILVLGSATGGLLSRVLLGANAYRILRHAPVPVVLVPET